MRVLGVGNCTLDHIAVVDRFLEPDAQKEVLQFSQQGGGAVATATAALARWGAESAIVGKVGNDARGRQIVKTLSDEGVDISKCVLQDNAVSQLSMITIEQPTGRRQTVFTRGNVDPLRKSEIDDNVLDSVDFLLVDGTHPSVEIFLMESARARGIRVMLDAQENTPSIREAVAHCDVLVASERFASQFAGVGELKSLCNALIEKGPTTVVVTLGDEGCVAMQAGDREMIRSAAFPVQVVDTTGAGEVFHAGVIFGLIQGWSLAKITRFANVAAGLTCSGIGARGPLPTLDAITDRL